MDKQQLKTAYKEYFAPCLQKATDLVIECGNGPYLYTVDGEQYLDFVQGIAVNPLGHCHPAVVEAACAQVGRLCHGSFNLVSYPSTLEMAAALRAVTPSGLDVFFFTNSGAEAVESALKLARYVSRKNTVIAFRGSFHGRTMGAASVTSSKSSFRKHYSPFLPQVYFAPYPYCYRCPFGRVVETCNLECLAYLQQDLDYIIPAQDVGAVLFEMVQGEGGYIVPPRKYVDALVALCQEIGTLLIVDEVQTGMGRTGKMFASEHFGVTPDILCLGKAVGGGFPMAIAASTRELMDRWESGSHGTTFGGHPVAAAAGLAQLEVLREKGFLDAVIAKGERFRSALYSLQESFPAIGDIRGLGLMNAVEFVKENGEPDPEKAGKVREYFFSRKTLVLTCGVNGQAVRFIPPLNIEEALLDSVLDQLAEALGQGF